MGPGGTPSHLEALAMEYVVPILEKVMVSSYNRAIGIKGHIGV